MIKRLRAVSSTPPEYPCIICTGLHHEPAGAPAGADASTARSFAPASSCHEPVSAGGVGEAAKARLSETARAVITVRKIKDCLLKGNTARIETYLHPLDIYKFILLS